MAKKKSFDADSYPGSIDRLHINPNMFPFDAFPVAHDGDDTEIKMHDKYGIHGRLRFKSAGTTGIGSDTTLGDSDASYLYYMSAQIQDVTITLPAARTNMGKMLLFLCLSIGGHKCYIQTAAGSAILCNGLRYTPGNAVEIGSAAASGWDVGYAWVFGMTSLYWLVASTSASGVNPPYKLLTASVSNPATSVTIAHGLDLTYHPIQAVSGTVTDTTRQVTGVQHDATNVYLYFDGAITGTETASAIVHYKGNIF